MLLLLDSKVNPKADTEDDSEEVELDEHSEESYVKERAQKFLEISLNILDEMERDIQKCRKNGKDVKEKHKFFTDQIITEGSDLLSPTLFKKHQDCINVANEVKDILEKAEKEGTKFDKDDCLKTIDAFRTKLRNLTAF